jgi:hypothetical protein
MKPIEAQTDDVQLQITDDALEISTHKTCSWSSLLDQKQEIELLSGYSITGIIPGSDNSSIILIMDRFGQPCRLAKLQLQEGAAIIHSMTISSETLQNIESTGITGELVKLRTLPGL